MTALLAFIAHVQLTTSVRRVRVRVRNWTQGCVRIKKILRTRPHPHTSDADVRQGNATVHKGYTMTTTMMIWVFHALVSCSTLYCIVYTCFWCCSEQINEDDDDDDDDPITDI